MKKLFLSLGVLTLLASCQDSVDELLPDMPEASASADLPTGIQRDITENILTHRFGGYTIGQMGTRAAEDFSLVPYILDGDTVLYVAQYSEGWDIYAGSHAAEMVLFSSDQGRFSMDDPGLPEQLRLLIEEKAASIGALIDSGTDYVDPSWGHLAVSEEEMAQAQAMALVDADTDERAAVSSESLPPGHWVLIKSEVVDEETYVSPKLVKTEWGDGSPWNAYSALIMDPVSRVLTSGVAGCVAVTLAQYEYLTHFKDGVPVNAPAGARLNAAGTDYVFTLSSSTEWNMMARTRSNSGTNETALLIGGIGHSVNTIYGLFRSTASTTSMLSHLNSTYSGKGYAQKAFSYADVKYWVDRGYPVIASARITQSQYPHVFLIDGYREYNTVNKYTYGLVRDPLPPGTVDIWLEDLVDQYGNILKYAYTKEVTMDSQPHQVITMNWGWDGSYNQVECFPADTWTAGPNDFSLEHNIYPMAR